MNGIGNKKNKKAKAKKKKGIKAKEQNEGGK
jgi:hypothetical protein